MKYELKKLLSSVQMIICLFLLTAFLAFFVVQSYRGRDKTKEDYTKLINEFSEKYTDENELIQALSLKRSEAQRRLDSEGDNAFIIKGEYGETLMSDFLLLDKAYNYANYIYKDFKDHRKRIIKDSLYLMEETSDRNIKTEYQTSVEKYNRVIDTEFTNTGDITTATLLFDFTIWDYAMLAFVIMLTVRMFTLDRESGAYKMVFSSYYGKGKLFVNQLSVCLFIGFLIIILHTICQLVCGWIFYGINNYSLPIQSYKYFEFCPLHITLGEYFLVKTAGKLILIVATVSVTALITCLLRKNILSIVMSIVVVIGSMLLNTRLYLLANEGGMIESQEKFAKVREFLPTSLLKPDEYFKLHDYICIFNTAVPRFCCVIVITALFSIICIGISYKSFTALRRV